MLVQKILLIIVSYLIGSILFAEFWVKLLKKESLFEISHNYNPGVSNAFKYGGVVCGIFAVIGDLAKGIIPVILYRLIFNEIDFGITLVMFALALGHAYSIFHRFRGGMCITVSFGMFIGLLPDFIPLAILVVLFLTLLATRRMSTSLISMYTYIILIILMIVSMVLKFTTLPVGIGVILVSILICYKMWYDLSEKEKKLFKIME